MPTSVEPMDLEISIVSLGDSERLMACVSTLASACEGLHWRLAVVDNARSRQDLEAALALAPSAIAIRSEGTRGFGANHNLVLQDVLAENRARYVLVLNDDTELSPRAVTTLVDYADRDPTVAAVSPQILDAHGRHEPSRLPWPSIARECLRTAFPRRKPLSSPEGGWLNGACILLRTSALREVGLFDTTFFLFFEDADLCRRLANAGWRLGVCPASSIVHHGHKTILAPQLRPAIEEQVLRSRYLFFRKHHGPVRASAVTMLVRVALLMRVVKMIAEAAVGRGGTGFSQPRTLWELTRGRPTRPSRLEREAGLQPLP